MPEIRPDHAPSPRAALGTDLANYYVLRVDATGHLQVHVLTSGLPVGAATAAAQALALAQLQTIAEIRDALQSVATDRLQVRGEDQLFSYAEALIDFISAIVSGADGRIQSGLVPAGEIWHITNCVTRDQTSPTTTQASGVFRAGVTNFFGATTRAIAAGELIPWAGDVWLEEDDRVRTYFAGALAGDTCELHLTGHIMTMET